MRQTCRPRSFAALFIVVCLLVAPITALAKKGEKNYKRGLEHETAQQWEKAAQEFALAVAALPSDVEYQLHYRRAIFNASQSFMLKGRALAEQGNHVGAYNAFRQAYGYDQVNELALSEMERMLRLQREKEGGNGGDNNSRGGDSRIAPTTYQTPRNGNGSLEGGVAASRSNSQEALPSARAEQLRIINYTGDLEPLIRQLADELDLNVFFDRDFSQQVGKRQVTYRNLRGLTTARALDYIFQSQGLFFQKLDRRTILVADQQKRAQYQQLVLRTFYLSNIDPTEAKTAIQQALPPNQGRPATMYANKSTNSLTVRDTPETVRIIGELLQGLDKDRAEVVMEVNIYEVSRSDLQQLGGQFGNATTLGNLGGTSGIGFGLGGSSGEVARQTILGAAPTALGAAILVPPLVLSALQSKRNTRLLSSSQLHAFDSDKSTISVGRKVPIQTGAFTNFSNNTQNNNNTGGVNPGVFGGYGAPIIQYEQTGLDLTFTPQVFPNMDVQVKMEIKSAEVEGTAGAANLTPILSNRTISGMARIQNNRTMMLASIAQDRQSTGRDGIPLLGLIPVIGRLFSTPRRDNAQSDIVITLTPRVLRAPNVTPRDQELRPSGSMQAPTPETLEALIRDADRDDQLAAARSLPTNVSIQLPAEESPAFVPAPKILMDNAGNNPSAAQTTNHNASADAAMVVPALNVRSTAPPLPVAATSDKTGAAAGAAMASTVELRIVPEAQGLRVGEKRRLMLMLKTDAPLGLAAAALRFDPRVVAIRSVTRGAMFTQQESEPVITQSIDPKGMLLISLAPAAGASPLSGEGVLLVIEIEGIAPGESAVSFDGDKVHFIAADGRSVRMQVVHGGVKVTK